jgi:outer membrane immunogenic protein
MRKQLLLCSVAAIAITTALSGPVAAADLPLKARPEPAPSIYAPNWSGFYIGGHVGYGQSKFTGADSAGTPQWSTKPKGFLLGFHAGHNWQVGQWVYGLEGDLSTMSWNALTMEHGAASSQLTGHLGGLASIRGRLGWAFDRTLIYATGGVAWAQWNGIGASTPISFGSPKITTGAVAGGGIEWKYSPNLSLRLEGLQYWINKTQFQANSSGYAKIKTVSVVRLGASWHFDGGGWGKGPVASRY